MIRENTNDKSFINKLLALWLISYDIFTHSNMNLKNTLSGLINWKNIRFFACITLIILIFWEISFAHTDTPTTTGTSQENQEEANSLKTLVGMFFKFIAMILAALTGMVWFFLTPEWINGELFHLGAMLKYIWIMVSNVVYLIFAILLIVIAFMNIIWKWEGTWELKQALPKFIVGVLIVPFSWFFVQLILSVSSVLTISALTLPLDALAEVKKDFWWKEISSALNSKDESNSDKKQKKICQHHILYMGSKSDDSSETGTDTTKGLFECAQTKEEQLTFVEIIENFSKSDSVYGIMYLYTYGIMDLDDVDILSLQELAGKLQGDGEVNGTSIIATLSDLTFKVIFNLAFLIVYLVLLSALFIALFVRGILLWWYVMLSPFFGLSYFLWKDVGWEKFSVKEFISLALVPVYVSLALSFGLLFLYMAGQSAIFKAPVIKDANGEIIKPSSKLSIGNAFSLEIKWTGWDNALSDIGEIIMKMFGLVILWMWVMTALKQSQITAQIISPIEQFGTQVWSLVAKSPMYAPIIPGWAAGTQSIASMTQVAQKWVSYYQQKPNERAEKFLWETELFGRTGDRKVLSDAMRNYGKLIDNNSAATQKWLEHFNKILYSGASAKTLLNDSGFIDKLNLMLKAYKIEWSDAKIWDWASLVNALHKLDAKTESWWEWVLKWQKIGVGDFNWLEKALKEWSPTQKWETDTTSTTAQVNKTINLDINGNTLSGKPITRNSVWEISSLWISADNVAKKIFNANINEKWYKDLVSEHDFTADVKKELAKYFKKDGSGGFTFDEEWKTTDTSVFDEFLKKNKK